MAEKKTFRKRSEPKTFDLSNSQSLQLFPVGCKCKHQYPHEFQDQDRDKRQTLLPDLILWIVLIIVTKHELRKGVLIKGQMAEKSKR